MKKQLKDKDRKLCQLAKHAQEEANPQVITWEKDENIEFVQNKMPQNIKNFALEEIVKVFQEIPGEINSQKLTWAAQAIVEKMNQKFGNYWECIIFDKKETHGYSIFHAKKRVIKVFYREYVISLHKQ